MGPKRHFTWYENRRSRRLQGAACALFRLRAANSWPYFCLSVQTASRDDFGAPSVARTLSASPCALIFESVETERLCGLPNFHESTESDRV